MDLTDDGRIAVLRSTAEQHLHIAFMHFAAKTHLHRAVLCSSTDLHLHITVLHSIAQPQLPTKIQNITKRQGHQRIESIFIYLTREEPSLT